MARDRRGGGDVTARAVAEHAGVAISSVSRVLNDHPDVSDGMRERVLRAVAELEYRPNLLAQSLRSGSTRTVGFVVRDISNPLFADITKGAEEKLRSAGYSMILVTSGGHPDLDAEYIELLLRRQVDGLILSLQSENHPATVKSLSEADRPLVLLDREVSISAASAVLCDHFTGVSQATSHVLESGHRRIGFIIGPGEIRASRERLRGYEEAHTAAGVPIDATLVRRGSYVEDFAYVETRSLLEHDDPPTAIMTGGIQLTFGALRALYELGLRPGRDISFVSCDEIELMRLFDPALNVVLRPTVRMGQLAAELLVRHMRGDTDPRVEPVATTYIKRESVQAPVPVRD